MNLAVLILAAGASSRLGQPKQLIEWRGKKLIEHVLANALSIEPTQIFVSLGFQRDKMVEIVGKYPVVTIDCGNWKRGMGSTISDSIEFIQNYSSSIDTCMILLADQPTIHSLQLKNLVSSYLDGLMEIPVFTQYSDTIGVPAIYPKKMFAKLKSLKDDHGAKKLIQNSLSNYKSVMLNDDFFDVDTPEDLEKLHQLE